MLRKTASARSTRRRRASASMRPEQRCSGKLPAAGPLSIRLSCFNEAGAAMLRKTPPGGSTGLGGCGCFNEAGAAMLRKTWSRPFTMFMSFLLQ